ncbi:MAG: Gfo/Idh/MocA family oxidoreductase [Agriterribacter sp.]
MGTVSGSGIFLSKNYNHPQIKLKRRDFLKTTATLASVSVLPSSAWAIVKNGKLRTAHIGVGGMGHADLNAIASHPLVEMTALCDVDSVNLAKAGRLHPNAKTFKDYRRLFDETGKSIDAVIVSTPDHTHAPASVRAMVMGKPVYCQKPLTHLALTQLTLPISPDRISRTVPLYAAAE